jgi:hypothetical protein
MRCHLLCAAGRRLGRQARLDASVKLVYSLASNEPAECIETWHGAQANPRTIRQPRTVPGDFAPI